MTPAKHPPGEHLPTCGDPFNCAEYAAVMRMTISQNARWQQQQTARHTARRRVARAPRAEVRNFAPPDPYEKGLAALRAALKKERK